MRTPGLAVVGLLWLVAAEALPAPSLPAFDFTQPGALEGWHATHDVAPLQAVPEGMAVEITGSDPYLTGPPRDYPPGQLLWLRLRLKSDMGGGGQVFYFTRGASEENSVRFPVRAGVWEEVRVPLPALGPGYRLRIDPPGTRGTCVIASLSFEPRTLLKEPSWPRPHPPAAPSRFLPPLRSGPAELSRNDGLGGFVVSVAGVRMAIGHSRPLIGYLHEGETRWLDLRARARVSFHARGNGFQAVVTAPDTEGAHWRITRTFAPSAIRGAFDVTTEVRVDRERSVIFLPMLLLFPGVGSFGGARHQGLFAGLEYLDKPDTSSSEADIIGPGSKRQVPDTLRITFPLMAIQAADRYVGLVWEMAPYFSALFDSPDRIFGSGGHVMGVLFPGSDGVNRAEGNLLPYQGEPLKPGQPLTLRATLIAGWGKSVVPAVQQYVSVRGLPPLPGTGADVVKYSRLAAGGWLDSKIREGWRFRHAYWPGVTSFGPHPAGDAPLFMEWLAGRVGDEALSARLREGASLALALVEPSQYDA
ncbi:MAG: hypothetical protein QHJ73_03320, partial [Armatimonadota bacterium]|nr:hypothetical protein [Armatimonadota bacterium]